MKVVISQSLLQKAILSNNGSSHYIFGEDQFTLTTDDNIKLEECNLTPRPAGQTRIEVYPGKDSSVVNHPTHYNSGKIEVIEAIEDWKINFHLGNTIKYVARAGKKDPTKEIEDLEKAEWYLKRRIEILKAEKENRVATRPNDMNPRRENGKS